jgi:hypothetical protein
MESNILRTNYSLKVMAFISDLPSELLLQIFQHLSCIDDVHILARCSRLLYSIISDSGNLTRIMKSTIVRSSRPKNDSCSPVSGALTNP